MNARILLKIFLRTYLVGAAFNTKGMQNIGLAYIMDPALIALYGADKGLLQRARSRYLKFYNTHTFWTPLLVGIFLSMEKKIVRGLLPPDILPKLRTTTVYTLSALGDSFFGGSLLVTWALLSCILAMEGRQLWLVLWLLCSFVALQLFKAITFARGYAQGLAFLQRLKAWNLIDWGQRLKLVNGFLLAFFWVRLEPGNWRWTLGATAIVSVLAAFSSLRTRDRCLILAMMLLLALFMPWNQIFAVFCDKVVGV